ncbi:uncharacterized protein LOC143225517 [Tachypleus tridentatus]|uniref:uncharacterized protein LOC143225517 n=1 Tax=Tachypleus tridentatus TaxID=6853 RepID=UPI003FD20516
MMAKRLFVLVVVTTLLVSSLEAVPSSSSNKVHFGTPENRQSIVPGVATASGLSGLNSLLNTGALGSLGGLGTGLAGLLTTLITALAPILVLFGLGALLLPLIGIGGFREGAGRALDDVNPALIQSLTEIFENVNKALENVDKKYN